MINNLRDLIIYPKLYINMKKRIPLYYLKQPKKSRRRQRRKKGGSLLYKNFCRNNLDKQNSPHLWLNPLKLLDNDQEVDSNIIKTLMKNKKFVIKIQPYRLRKKHIDNEIKWYKKLNEVDNGNFIKYICSFTCNNDEDLIKKSNKVELFCTSKNKKDYSRVVIIEYINGITLEKYQVDNLDKFYSIFSQLILSYIEAFFNYGFIYNDYRGDNIMIRKTNKKIKIYKILGKYYKIKTYGIEPIFFNFGITSLANSTLEEKLLSRNFKHELESIMSGLNISNNIINKSSQIFDDVSSIDSRITKERYAIEILKKLLKHYPVKN